MKAILILQILLLVYHQITTAVDLFPFNSARFYSAKEKLIECVVNAVLMSLPVIGFAFQNKYLMNFAAVYYFVLFAIELKTWWVPYIFGASDEWKDTYARLHSQTIIVLPKIKDNPIPNLEHVVLHLFTLVTAVFTLIWRQQIPV